MGILTTLTRMWLTRSTKPFTFTCEADDTLAFEDCRSPGLYVHIPFCRNLCDFCPYCKELYTPEKCDRYIDHLLQEIHLVGRTLQKKKTVTSLYFGGGTPALAAGRISEIICTLQEYFIITEGIGIELHPLDVRPQVLQALKEAGVTKISIGIQSFLPKYQALLGRKSVSPEKISEVLSAFSFETVSMDFIFALPRQTYADLRSDVKTAFSCGANHVALYPFIDFSFTKSTLSAMKKEEKRRLLVRITTYCESLGYRRTSIWTFAANASACYSSMTRDNFLGFGCSAATLLHDQFKINTFSVAAYEKQIQAGLLPTSLTLRFTRRQRMIYYLFWTAYSTQVREADFEAFFGVPLRKMYGLEFYLAEKLGFVTRKDGVYTLTEKGVFYYHHYENFYTLSYIDQMWGKLRQEPFPERMEL